MLFGNEILTTAQMRAIESAAMDSGEVTGLELMERAGAAVVNAILDRWPDLRMATVLCGPGNNGGDGFVIARLLKEAGIKIVTFYDGDPARLPPDAAANHDRWRAMCSEDDLWFPDPDEDIAAMEYEIASSGVVVDALIGMGGNRPLKMAWAIHLANAADWHTPIVAVDGLSGLNLDTGRFAAEIESYGDAPRYRAALTVTFQRAKTGHMLEDGPARSGELLIADIGLECQTRHYFETGGPFILTDCKPSFRMTAASPRLAKAGGHKYDHGHALILAGGAGKGGAARLAARAALRCGAGLVTLACPSDALAENAAALPDAIMLRPLDGPDDLRAILSDRRISAVCAGPGLGLDRAAELLPVLADDASDPEPTMWIGTNRMKYDLPLRSGRGLVLDGDALTAGARQLRSFMAGLHMHCVLTPHDGEFARVFPDLGARLKIGDPTLSRLDAVVKAAIRAKCVVLLKGPTTVISANARAFRNRPPVEGWINAASGADATPWLATAGSGDVLAGLITGLLARGIRSDHAAATGAWLHAAAARRFGPGLIADDLPDEIPGVFRDINL